MPLNDIVNVQITRQTQSVSEAGFGTLMILGTFKNWNDLLRKYSNMNDVAQDFSPNQLEYIAAQDVFAQNITPPFIYIGRRTVDVVDIAVETAMPAQEYTTTINGTACTINSTTDVVESQVSLSGIVTNVITFSTDFNSGTTAITPTVNGVVLAPTAWTTDQATTLEAVADVIEAAAGVASATPSGDVITVVFTSAVNATVNEVTVVGTGSQPTVTIAPTGPLVTDNLINVSVNGTIVGTVTSIIDFDIDFVSSNVIVATVNGVALSSNTFTSDQATTIAAVAAKIGTATGVASSTVTDTKQITVVFTSAGNNTVNSVVTTSGSTQPEATISEGGFVFDTDSPTTMSNIAAAILAQPSTNIVTAVVSGVNSNILTLTSKPNTNGIVDFFTVKLGASQATAAIVNTTQPTTKFTIANAMVTEINTVLSGSPVVATEPGSPDGTYILTAAPSGTPYTVEVSTDITNPTQARVLITQAEPNAAYTVKLNGLQFIYTAPVDVVDNEQIAEALVDLITDGTYTPIVGDPYPNPLIGVLTATDNGNGSFEVITSIPGQAFSISVTPIELLTVEKGLIIGPYTPSTSVVTDLEAIQDVNDEWYALACTDRTVATVKAIAAWVESQIKIFGTSSSDLNIINEDAGTDNTSIAYYFKTQGYVRSFVMYHADSENDFPECAWFGGVLPLQPGSETWKFKTLNSISYSDLSTNQENNAFAKNCNTYEYVGGVGITQNGTMAQGEYIDIIRGVDWLTSTIQTNVYSILVNSPKIPYTNAGITAIEAQIRKSLQVGIDNNFIATEPPFTVTVPLAQNVSSNDKANRILNNVRFQATLAGAIHAINISGTVSV